MNDHADLIRRLREQRIPNWIHSTGETPRQNGMKQCPLCEEAATALESAKRVPLTKKQRADIARRVTNYPFLSPMDIVDEVERAHRIGAEGQVPQKEQKVEYLTGRSDGLAMAKAACESIAIDRRALYKGRAPYTGREEGRADPHIDGESDGASKCAEAIEALLKTKPTKHQTKAP